MTSISKNVYIAKLNDIKWEILIKILNLKFLITWEYWIWKSFRKVLLSKGYLYRPNNHRKSEIKTWLDLSNFATNYDLKKATFVDTPGYVKKVDLANLKCEVNKLDVDKLTAVPVF